MDKQRQLMATVKMVGKISIWLGLLIFFFYSYRAVMNFESISEPGRQDRIMRILTALAQPNLFKYEYKTRETLIILEKSCNNPNDTSQVVEMDGHTLVIDIICTGVYKPMYTIHGSRFQPNTTGYILWDSASVNSEEQSLRPSRFSVDGKGNFSIKFFPVYQAYQEKVSSERTLTIVEQLDRTFQGFSEISRMTAEQMWETIQIAFLATSISTILAIPFTFFTARTSSYWGRSFNILLQPMLAAVRSVHPLIIVIPATVTFGIGPSAGVVALALFSTAVLIGKFSEYAQQHTSLSWPALLRVHFPGLAFRHFPTNLLIATVIGFLGGGGIGFLLQQELSLLDYHNAGVALFMIIIVGGSLDLLSRAVWHKIQRIAASQPATAEKEAIPFNFNTPLTPH